MELETVNKLFLELSQFATATTAREIALAKELAEVKAQRDDLIADLAKAKVADDAVLPSGWELAATQDGGIIVIHKTLGGCFVTEKENEPREIPGQILFYLASDILAAQQQKKEV